MIEIYFFWHFISTCTIFHRFSIFYLEMKTNCAWQNKRIGYGTFMLTRSVCFAASSEFFMIVSVYLNGFCIVISYNQIKLYPPLIIRGNIFTICNNHFSTYYLFFAHFWYPVFTWIKIQIWQMGYVYEI